MADGDGPPGAGTSRQVEYLVKARPAVAGWGLRQAARSGREEEIPGAGGDVARGTAQLAQRRFRAVWSW